MSKEYDLNVHLCVKAFALEEEFKNPRYCAQDIFGRPRVWFGSGCPNNLELRERSLERVRQALKIPNVDGILLDGIRFASPGEGLRTFFTCFCESCKKKAGKMGYEFFALKDSVLDFYKSISSAFRSTSMELLGNMEKRISEWIRFRCECIAEHVANVRRLVKDFGEVSSSDCMPLHLLYPASSAKIMRSYANMWTS